MSTPPVPTSNQRMWAGLGLVLALVALSIFIFVPSPWKLGGIPLLLVLLKVIAPRAIPKLPDNNADQ